MALENRDVRPFRDLETLQGWLQDNLRMCIRTHQQADWIELSAGSTVRLDPLSMSSSDIMMKYAAGADPKEQLRIAKKLARELGDDRLSLFSVVLLASSPFLRFTDRLFSWNLDGLMNFVDGFSLIPTNSERPRCLRLAHHGVYFDLIVVLNRELTKKTGLPHRLGTWLARVQFTLASPTEGIGFTPLPLNDDRRQELGLAKQTATFSRVNPFQEDILGAVNLDDFVEFYVDDELLTRMSANPRHPQSVMLQAEIFIDAINFVILQFQKLENMDEIQWNDVDGSLLGKVVRIVSDENIKDLQSWFETLKTNPEIFIAAVEDVSQYRKRTLDSMTL